MDDEHKDRIRELAAETIDNRNQTGVWDTTKSEVIHKIAGRMPDGVSGVGGGRGVSVSGRTTASASGGSIPAGGSVASTGDVASGSTSGNMSGGASGGNTGSRRISWGEALDDELDAGNLNGGNVTGAEPVSSASVGNRTTSPGATSPRVVTSPGATNSRTATDAGAMMGVGATVSPNPVASPSLAVNSSQVVGSNSVPSGTESLSWSGSDLDNEIDIRNVNSGSGEVQIRRQIVSGGSRPSATSAPVDSGRRSSANFGGGMVNNQVASRVNERQNNDNNSSTIPSGNVESKITEGGYLNRNGQMARIDNASANVNVDNSQAYNEYRNAQGISSENISNDERRGGNASKNDGRLDVKNGSRASNANGATPEQRGVMRNRMSEEWSRLQGVARTPRPRSEGDGQKGKRQ